MRNPVAVAVAVLAAMIGCTITTTTTTTTVTYRDATTAANIITTITMFTIGNCGNDLHRKAESRLPVTLGEA